MIVKKILTIFLIVFILGVGTFLVYFGYLVKSKAGQDSTKEVFEVKDQSSTLEIAQNLEAKQFVKSDWAFYVYAKLKEKTLKPGAYLLSQDMTTEQIVNKISDGKTAVRKVTIPEGWRMEQIAQYLDNNNYANYDEFVALAKEYEGKIFPDTYYVTVDSKAKEILEMMLEDYKLRTEEINPTADDLVLASIIEREAKNDSERTAIAGVYKNRLKIDMKMEADPTVLYAHDSRLLASGRFDLKSYEFWQPIAFADYLKETSPYNTYLNKGLPPAPICNPGLKSIEAAKSPDTSNYMYFFHGKDGKIYLSETVAEHDRKKALYLK